MKKLLSTLTLAMLCLTWAQSQSVPFPTTYRDFNAVSPWGYNQVGTTWDTSPFLPFIYQDMWFRIMPPNGVTWNSATNTWNNPSGQTYPLILFFQGAGELGTDNNNQLKWGGQMQRDAILSGAFPGFALYPQGVAADKAKILLEKLFTVLPIDINRIYMHGLSNGGVWTWDFLIKYPTLVAGAFPMSASEDAAKNTSLLFNPIRQVQGSLDTNPSPAWTQTIVDWEVAHGANYEYFLLDGVGHGTWNYMYARPDFFPWFLSQKKNRISVLFNKYQICPGDPVNVMMGFTPGFDSYEWRKDGVLMTGENRNSITATAYGSYTGRIKNRGIWSAWSDPVVVNTKPVTTTPAIQLNGLKSNVLPAPDGSTTTSLILPDGYQSYTWYNSQQAVVSTSQVFSNATVGSYTAVVQEANGCSSIPSPVYTVASASGPYKPEGISGLMGFATSQTQVTLNWTDNPSPQYNETGFEIYRATNATGPYALIAINPADVDVYNDINLRPNTTYYYLIRPVNLTAAATVGPAVSVLTQVDDVAPTSPIGLQVTGTTDTSATLSWGLSSDNVGIYKYDIYKNGTRTLAVDGPSATVYNLITSQVYNFTVRARDFTGNVSPESNQATTVALSTGLNYKYYEGTWSALPNFNNLTPVKTGNSKNIDLNVRNKDTNFALYWEGKIYIAKAGNYTFETYSDDGSKVYFGTYNESNLLVNNDGAHGLQYRSGTKRFNTPGLYPIVITYYQGSGGFGMSFYWSNTPTGITTRQLVPASAFTPNFQYPTPPAAPTLLTATSVSYNQINLYWKDNSSNETGFQLFRATSNGGPYNVVATIPANTQDYSDTNLQPSTQYFYRIQAVGATGQSGFSNELLHGLAYNYYEQTLTSLSSLDTYSPAAIGTSGYFDLLVRKRDTNFAFTWQGSIRIPTAGSYTFYTNSSDGSNLYLDGTLLVNNDYTQSMTERSASRSLTAGVHAIQVNYRKGTGTLGLTVSYRGPGIAKQQIPLAAMTDVEVNAKTMVLPPPPAQPTNLVASATSPNSIRLTWSDNSTDEVSYQIYRATNTPANFLLYKTLDPNSPSFIDNGLLANVSYYYKVAAVNVGGSSYSNEVNATTLNSTPVITKLQTQVIKAGATTSVSVISTDADQEPLNLYGLNIPAFGKFLDQTDGSGTLTLSPTLANIGTYQNVMIVVRDQHNGSDTTRFTIDVNNQTPPSIMPIADVTVAEGATTTQIISATSNFSIEDLTWTFTGIPAFAHFSVSNGVGMLSFSPGYVDSGPYPIQVTVTDPLALSATRNFMLNVTKADPNITIPINFYRTTTAASPWNNVNTGTSAKLSDSSGKTTTISLAFLTSWWNTWTEGATTGNNAGVYPDNVIQDYYYFGVFGGPSSVDVRVNGLDPHRIYTFNFLASSRWTGANDNGSTIFRIGSTSDTINVQNNSRNLAVIPNVSPAADSTIVFTMSKLPSSPAGFINALVIQSDYQPGSAPVSPRNLDAAINENNTVGLTWVDAPFNETGYDVYKSESKNGLFIKLNAIPLSANSTQYADTTISEGKEYFYKAVAFNTYGRSPDSNIDSVLIPNLAPRLTISGDLDWPVAGTTAIKITGVDPPNNTFTLAVTGLPSFASFVPINATSANIVANPQAKDIGTYSFTVIATDTEGAVTTQLVTVSVTENTLSRIFVNFSQASNAPSPWNNTSKTPVGNDVFSNLLTDSGTNSGATLTLTTAFGGVYNQGPQTGDNSGIVPDAVLREYYWFGAYNAASIIHMKLSGLSKTNKYNFKFVAASSYTGLGNNGSTIFTIGSKSASVGVQDNISNLAVVDDVVTNSAGEIYVDVSKSPDAAAGYVNGMIIEAVPLDPSTFTPGNLMAYGTSKSQISLSWADNSSTETGFEVWRAGSNGVYALIRTTSSDATTYTDNGLSAGQLYYYKVRAILPGGQTDYSNIACSGTIAFTVYVNINGVSTYDAPAPWNNLTRIVSDGDVFYGFKNDAAQSTGILMRWDKAMEGANDWGMNTGNNSGIYPDAVLRSFYWTNAYQDPAIVVLGGLDQSFNYNLTFFGSINTNSNVSTVWGVGSNKATLREDMNISTTTAINNVVPSLNSEIQISIQEAAGSPWSIFNALVINAYPTDRKIPAGQGARMTSAMDGNMREVRYGLANPMVTLYPNPVTETSGLHVRSDDSVIGAVQYTVVNMMGVEVYRGIYQNDNINADFGINFDNQPVPPGVYIMQFKYSDGRVVAQKFIKM